MTDVYYGTYIYSHPPRSIVPSTINISLTILASPAYTFGEYTHTLIPGLYAMPRVGSDGGLDGTAEYSADYVADDDNHDAFAGALEDYLSRSLGIAVIVIGLLTVLLTGSIPLTASFADPAADHLQDPAAPYALPTLVITGCYHAAVAFFCYMMWNETGNFGFGVSTIVGSGLGGMAIWCVLFAGRYVSSYSPYSPSFSISGLWGFVGLS
ncbi:hypothetical protein ABW21_db0204584 [Orbilia brochopaga]|nr:hypothetical protein ABW21_db0204584 [Drechslerella brochopaga]